MKKEYIEAEIQVIDLADSIYTEGGQEYSICNPDVCSGVTVG